MLGSRSSRRPLKTVKLENGELTTTEAQRQQRGQEHFCSVAAGKLYLGWFVAHALMSTATWTFSSLRFLEAMKSLPSHRGCGPDLLPAELLQASGMAGASAIADVCGRKHLEEKWLLQWKGGRQIDLFKSEVNVQDCDASRGLMLADTLSKIPATILKREYDPQYCAHIPASHFGAVPSRHHMVDSVLQKTSAISLSVAALFLDLQKAFDRAGLEAVMGCPSHVGSDPTSRRAHLENVGFPPVVVRA